MTAKTPQDFSCPQQSNADTTDGADTEALLSELHSADLSADEFEAALDNLLDESLSQVETFALITDTKVLEQATPEQLREVFGNLDTSTLDEATKTTISEAMQDAPEAARQVFEDEVDLYLSGFNSYTPLGSNVPIGTRRVLIATTVATSLIAGRRRTRTS